MPRKIFISHKNEGDSNYIGGELEKLLKQAQYDVFIDENIKAGDKWQNVIVSNLIGSDVVVVLLEQATGGSHWVQREIDMANALGISILPLIYGNIQNEQIQDALRKFDLGSIQYVHYTLSTQQKALQEVIDVIEPLAQETLVSQSTLYESWRERRQAELPKKKVGKDIPRRLAFSHPEAEDIQFYIACGDASQMKTYDVLVNTENNYMQMARFYETSTLSYDIRKKGAYFEDGVILIEDTIQDELYRNAKANGGLPVRDGRVLVTSAGHPLSELQKFTNYRYVFHVASVRYDITNEATQPINTIDRFISNCINKVEQIELNQGEVKFAEDDTIVPSQETFYPIESILFPVFGAGNGGKPFQQAVNEIVECFHHNVPQLIEKLNLSVRKVGLAVYFEDDVATVRDIFLAEGFKVISEA
ncbi:MAG: TIR domain-containing protein [Chloroflexota bacterium]